MGWQRRREKQVLQETCHFEWQNLIAEASRQGYKGEEELQWDSYQILNEELKKEWLESVEQRKKTPRVVGSRRAPKSAEQRKKISESISAKWADPVRFVLHLPFVALNQTFFFLSFKCSLYGFQLSRKYLNLIIGWIIICQYAT